MKIRRFFSWVIRIVVLLAVLLFLVVALLPSLLGSRRVQSRLLQDVNAGFADGQEVRWGRVSLRWFGAQRIEDIVFQDQTGQVTIKAISIEKGMWSMLGRDVHLGQIMIDSPSVAIRLPPPSDIGLAGSVALNGMPPEGESDILKPSPPRSPDSLPSGESSSSTSADTSPFRLPVDLRGAFVVRNGHLLFVNADDTETMEWEDIDLQVDFAQGLTRPIETYFMARQKHPVTTGHIQLTASVRIFQADGLFDPDTFHTAISLEIENLDTSAIAWILHEQAGTPMFDSILDAQLSVLVDGAKQVDFRLETHIADPVVSGGALGSDRFEIGNIDFISAGTWEDAILQVEEISLSNKMFRLHGAGSLVAEPSAFSSVTLQWDVAIDHVFSLFASAGMFPVDVDMAGLLRGAASVTMEDGKLLVPDFAASITNLRFAASGIVLEEPSVQIRWVGALALPPAAPALTLTEGSIKSATFSLLLPAVHFSAPAAASPLIALEAALTADLDALLPHVQAATGVPIDTEGESVTLFSWQGPVGLDWEKLARVGQGVADIRVPGIQAYGMHATNVVVTMQAQEGSMRFSLDTAANGGRVVIHPVVDITGDEPWLTVSTDAHVIQDVALTDEMASELLVLVHPLLRGSAVLGGSVNLTLETCRIPLSENGILGADVRGLFVLRDLELEPQGILLRIMETANLRSRAIRVAEEQIAFRLKDGRVYPSPLVLSISGHTVTLAGSVGLDTSLDYTVDVPVTSKLVGRDAFRYLEGSSLALAISGTATRPQLASDAFARAVASLVRDAAKNAIREEGLDAVLDLLRQGRH